MPEGAGRTLFVLGPAGDGSTTVAAATALAAARDGHEALLLSPAPPARLAALLGAVPPARPAEPLALAPRLFASGIDSAALFRSAVLAAQRLARPALDALGAGTLDDDELTELPGAAEAARLAALRAARAAAPERLIVLDLGSATEAVNLLALPGRLRRYLRRLLPAERRTARALRPLLAQLAGVPMPAEGLYEAAEGWERALDDLLSVIEGPGAAARLVLDPGERSAGTARTTRAGLALHGLPVEAVVANRLLPTGSRDPWLAALAERQRATLDAFLRQA
uniref:ArsA-related P-loop ATPase n=1 Tax=Streptomyces sp. SBT349 TaxID=1580539 RepID=UPI00066CEE8A